MNFLKLHSVFFSTLTVFVFGVRDTECIASAPKILQVQTVELQPMPYHINDTELLQMSLQSRQDICKRMLSEVNVPILYAADMNTQHVPPVHLYKINGEHLRAIRCPSLPAVYLSHEWISNTNQWYIRILEPAPIDHYKFNFEVADDVIEVQNRDLTDHLKPESDLLYSMNVEERWRLCLEARKYIRYNVTLDMDMRFSQPRFYSFTYNKWTETYLACRCDMLTIKKRYVFIRSDHSKASNTLTIILTNSEKGDLNGQELSTANSKMIP